MDLDRLRRHEQALGDLAVRQPLRGERRDTPLARGQCGPQGPQGPAGTNGADATKLFAVVASDGSLIAGSGVVSITRESAGQYLVEFSQSVQQCALLGSFGARNNAVATNRTMSVNSFDTAANASKVRLAAFTVTTGTAIDTGVQVGVFC